MKGDNPKLDISAAIYDLRRLNQTTSTQTSRIILDDVISKLEQGFGGEIEKVSWLLSAGPEYIKLLREGELVAMAVLMHYGVLLARRNDIWCPVPLAAGITQSKYIDTTWPNFGVCCTRITVRRLQSAGGTFGTLFIRPRSLLAQGSPTSTENSQRIVTIPIAHRAELACELKTHFNTRYKYFISASGKCLPAKPATITALRVHPMATSL
jgi:hypothetical protein